MLKYNKFETVFRGRGMTKTEMEEVFRTMDLNESGYVDAKEYDNFQNYFVKSFLACSGGAWKISADNAKTCVPNEKWFDNMRLNLASREEVSQASHENDSDAADMITDIVHVADRNLDGTINLAEYLFMRKAGSAWRQCVTGDGMNYMELKCALSVISLHPTRINKGDARKVFLTAIGWMMLNSKQLSYTVFFRVAQYYRSFTAYCRPTADCVINRRELTNQIELQTAPTSLTPLEAKYVNNYLNLLDLEVIDFPNFLIMTYWIDKFMMQAADDSLLSLNEFERLLADRSVSFKLRATIDYCETNIDRTFLKETAKRAAEMAEGGGISRKSNSGSGDNKKITEDDQFSHVRFMQTNGPVQKGIKSKDGGKHWTRKLIFNILDADATGTVDLKEFFSLIKNQKVFAKLADGDIVQDPWKITAKTLKRNKKSVANLQPGFPDEHAKKVMESLERHQLNNQEINFKEFLLMMEVDGIFRRYVNNPAVPAGVPLVDLVTNLKRFDLPVVSEETFLTYTLDMQPATAHQPALYNYLRAIYLLIMQEQFAISTKRQNETRKDVGTDFSKLADIEEKMFRQKFAEDNSDAFVTQPKVTHTPHYTPAPVYQQKETVKEEVKPEKSKPVEKAEEKESQVSVSSAQEETATTVKNEKTKEVSAASTQSGAEETQTKTA